MLRSFLLPIALATLLGCGGGPDSRAWLADDVETGCTVFLRLDALGMGREQPVSAGTNSLNGSDLTVSGNLIDAASDWVRIKNADGVIVIPRSAILMIEVYERK